ncbi:MAG TPA: hypothetical protein VGG29_00245 [Caulobacteraceae bacterium]
MAKSGQLIAALADLLGWSPDRVKDRWLMLLDGGMVTKGGRGFAAAQVTARDAAALLISGLGDLPPLDTDSRGVAGWSQFAFAACDSNEKSPWMSLAKHLPHLAALERRHTLLEALTALLEDAGASTGAADLNVYVGFISRLGRAHIRITLPDDRVRQPDGAIMLDHADHQYHTAIIARTTESSGFYAARGVTWGALQRLGRLVSSPAVAEQ